MQSESNTNNVLDKAIAACNDPSAPPERLSHETRSAIVRQAAAGESRFRPMARLFLPIRQMALAGAIPVVLAASAVGWMAVRTDRAYIPTESAFVEAAKVGDRVVFTIANGRTDHRVARSRRPDRFDPSASATVSEGSFNDRLDSGPDLVFYRID